MQRATLAEIEPQNGFNVSRQPLAAELANCLALGSRNLVLENDGMVRPWRGLNSYGAGSGSRVMMTLGSSWGGIKDIGLTQGSGSLFVDLGQSLWSIGAGQASIAGVNITGYTLSSLLKVCLLVNGSYTDADSGPFDAGLPQPSAPDIGIVSTPGMGYTGEITGPVSAKIARLRNSTGARSVASMTSAVVSPSAQTVRITFPLASAGQKDWAVFFTQQGFGGVGLSYRLAYQGNLDIPESVVAAGTVDGIARSLEFDYKDGDLVPELAYVDDYVPPAGTHAVRLENVMVVLGCYADASTGPTSTNPGTCGAVSLPNFYESYKPRNLVYFPEQVVGVLSRPTDSYAYVLCHNCILALQYVGVLDGPACSVTMVFPDVGVAHQQNACQAFGRLFLWVEGAGFIAMTLDGDADYNFGAPVREYTKNWDNTTAVTFNPLSMCIVGANGNEAVNFNLQTGKWNPPHYFSDAGVSGNALAGATSRGGLILSVNNAGTHTAYDYDMGATEMVMTTITSAHADPARGRAKSVFELDLALETDNTNQVVISLHRNQRRVYVRDGVTTNGSPLITSVAAPFDVYNEDDEVCVCGEDVGGSGIDFLIGRIGTVTGANQISIVNPDTGLALNAQADLTGCYLLIGYQILAFDVTGTGQQFLEQIQDFYMESALSYAVGVTQFTSAESGQVTNLIVRGTVSEMPVSVAT